MKLKRYLALFLAVVLTAACCACSAAPKTAEQALERMQAALQKTPCSHAEMVMELHMTPENGAQELLSRTTYDIRISQEPVSGCITATAEVDGSRSVTENYSLVEDGALVSYIHSGNVWMKLSGGQTPGAYAASASTVNVDASSAALDESVSSYEGREAICLSSQLDGAALQESLGTMLESLGQQLGTEGAEAPDCSALCGEARIYLDGKTCLPMAQELQVSGLGDVLAQLGVRAEITACTATIRYLSYEQQPEILLPEGAAEKAETWTRLLSGEPDNGDGTFTIREGSALVDIVPPEGFTLSDKGYDHLYFTREDQRQVRYTMYHSTAAQLRATVDSQLARYGDLPRSVSREQLSLAGAALDFEADVVQVVWSSYEEGLLYAWAELGRSDSGQYLLFVQVTDGYNDGLGGRKDADVTAEEFMDYLNAAVPSALMEQ